MKIDKTTPTPKIGIEAGKPDPAHSLLKLVNKELSSVEDIYKNLSTEYDGSVYEKFEKRFIETRNTFKGKLKDISDDHHDFINRSEIKREAVEKILKSSTAVAQRFQEARENKRLDRPIVTNSLEDLKYDLKNFKHIIKEQGKP